MKKKEEISIREQVSNAINKGRTAFNNWKSFNPSVEGMYSEDKFIIDKLELYLTDQIKSMEEERDVYKKRWENNNDQSDKDFTAINKLFQENKSLKSQLSDVDGQVKEKDRRYEKAMKQWDDERDVFKNQ